MGIFDILNKANGGIKQQMLDDLDSQMGTARENMVDPGITAAKDQQIANANQFRSNLDSTRADLQGQAANSSRAQLANDMVGVRNAANSRGLLYSGLRQAGEMGAQGQAAQGLAQRNAQINQGLETQAGQLERGGIQAGANAAQAQNSLADALAGRQQAAQEMKNQQISQIGGALGGVAGNIAGKVARK